MTGLDPGTASTADRGELLATWIEDREDERHPMRETDPDDGSMVEGQFKPFNDGELLAHGLAAKFSKGGELVQCGKYERGKDVNQRPVPVRLLPHAARDGLLNDRECIAHMLMFHDGERCHYVGGVDPRTSQPDGCGVIYSEGGEERLRATWHEGKLKCATDLLQHPTLTAHPAAHSSSSASVRHSATHSPRRLGQSRRTTPAVVLASVVNADAHMHATSSAVASMDESRQSMPGPSNSTDQLNNQTQQGERKEPAAAAAAAAVAASISSASSSSSLSPSPAALTHSTIDQSQARTGNGRLDSMQLTQAYIQLAKLRIHLTGASQPVDMEHTHREDPPYASGMMD